MHLEIERKFIVSAPPEDLRTCPQTRIEQGYLAVSSDGTEVRLRRKKERFSLTVKSSGDVARSEFEIELSAEQFDALWPATSGRRLEKVRHLVDCEVHTVEVDVYEGTLAGLVVAEVEFESLAESQRFTPPPWFGVEVTADARYKNKNLAMCGIAWLLEDEAKSRRP